MGLRKLTLHGNPIEDQENYRMFITLLSDLANAGLFCYHEARSIVSKVLRKCFQAKDEIQKMKFRTQTEYLVSLGGF